MSTTTKISIGVVAVIIIVGGGYYFSHKGPSMPTQPPITEATSTAPDTTTYATSTYSVTYPSDFTINTAYVDNNVVPGKPIAGVSFTIPGSMATGTNLLPDTYISIESLPRAKECTGDIYLAANVQSSQWSDPVTDVQYSLASSSTGAAGSFVDETIYAFPTSSPCMAVRYFVHTSDINNYPAGSIQPYDQTALLAAFDQIRQSIQLTNGAPATMATTTPVTPDTYTQ